MALGTANATAFVEFGLEIRWWTAQLGWYEAVVSLATMAKVHCLLPARLWTLQESGCHILHFRYFYNSV